MKTSFKKAMKLKKILPGISYLTQKGYLSGAFGMGVCLGGLCPDTTIFIKRARG